MVKKERNFLWRFVVTLVLSLVLLAFYYVSLNFSFFPFVMWGYMLALAGFTLAYIIYNRGMSRRGVTEDMLPDEWDAEKKREFIESGVNRLQRSKWMLTVIIAFVVTFAVEAVSLFLLPLINGLF
ncbi:MAG: hypothetical protein J6L85_01600 [Clostridia bacterium]|nr:hypothetical protein [Clostridia bacterium]